MEAFDLYSIDRILLGRTVNRGEKLPEGTFRAVVHICIIADDGKMLIQKRCSDDRSWGGMWDLSVGGHVSAGETARFAASRELKEELGLDINFENIRPVLTVNFDDGFDDIFVVKKNVALSDIVMQEDEVEDVGYASMEEIFGMIDSGRFIPYHKSLIELLFRLRDKRGAHSHEKKGDDKIEK